MCLAWAVASSADSIALDLLLACEDVRTSLVRYDLVSFDPVGIRITVVARTQQCIGNANADGVWGHLLTNLRSSTCSATLLRLCPSPSRTASGQPPGCSSP